MSERLRYIPETCPMYNLIQEECDSIKDILGENVYGLIELQVDSILEQADKIRNTCADLRETASDIASGKDEELEELRKDMQYDIDENVRICGEVQDDLYYAKERIKELEMVK